jgi:hypothetical protein
MKKKQSVCVKSVRYGYVGGRQDLGKYLKWIGFRGSKYLDLKGMVWESCEGLIMPRKVKITMRILKR